MHKALPQKEITDSNNRQLIGFIQRHGSRTRVSTVIECLGGYFAMYLETFLKYPITGGTEMRMSALDSFKYANRSKSCAYLACNISSQEKEKS